MDSAEKQQIKGKIQEALVAAEENIAALGDLIRPIAPDNAIGRLSRMDAINSKSINEAALSSARQKLVGLRYAMAHIDRDDYGVCIKCGDPIPVGRILVMPESNLCVDCAR